MRKKLTNDQKIIAAMDALDKGVRTLEKYAARYDTYIDQAFLDGDDARGKQLIKQKHKVNGLAKQLSTLKSHIELGAFSAQAISQLAAIPDAISGCKGLLAESPDFGKLGKSIQAIFRDMNKTEEEISKLNDLLAPTPEPTIASRLEGTPVSEEETSDWFRAEYESAMERLKIKVGAETVASPAPNTATGEIDYIGIMQEENNKK